MISGSIRREDNARMGVNLGVISWYGNLYFWEKFNGAKDFEGYY